MTSSGAYTENESVMQTLSHYQGFGGVGGSGYGRYMGHEGFKAFSNRKGCLHRSPMNVKLIDNFLSPLTPQKIQIVSSLADFGVFETTQNQVCKGFMAMFFLIALIIGYFNFKHN